MAKFISDVSGNHLEVSLESEEGVTHIVFRSWKKGGRSRGSGARITSEEFGHVALWLFEYFGKEGLSRRPLVEPLLEEVLGQFFGYHANLG